MMRLRKGPSKQRLESREALPLDCLLRLPVSHQTSLGLWPLHAQQCPAALALRHILIFQSDKSCLSRSHIYALLERGTS